MKNKKQLVLRYVALILLQVICLMVFMGMHRTAVLQGKNIMPSVLIGDEVTAPTLGRLIYMITALIVFFLTAVIANKLSFSDDSKKVMASFWLGTCSGILLWQGLGEDSWHFCAKTEHGMANFCQLEGVSSLFIMIMFLIFYIYVLKQNGISFGVRSVTLSFLFNWLSHYVVLVSYPFVQNFFTKGIWFIISGCGIGVVLLMGSIVFMLKKECTLKETLISSAYTYMGLGMIIVSIIEGCKA